VSPDALHALPPASIPDAITQLIQPDIRLRKVRCWALVEMETANFLK
jgi:hypothetical protein